MFMSLYCPQLTYQKVPILSLHKDRFLRRITMPSMLNDFNYEWISLGLGRCSLCQRLPLLSAFIQSACELRGLHIINVTIDDIFLESEVWFCFLVPSPQKLKGDGVYEIPPHQYKILFLLSSSEMANSQELPGVSPPGPLTGLCPGPAEGYSTPQTPNYLKLWPSVIGSAATAWYW